ncbi:MAG: hypothetical protein HJJLKODD_02718 [Phycisphaerae bacterium]|nr:hypothetical protein [Phycisphaerae bacterium]
MPIDVEAAVKVLSDLPVTRLRERYAEVFGEPTRSFNKQHLIKRITWRLQAIREGDLSERARRRARELANDADLRIRPPVAPTDANDNTPTATSPFRVKPDDRLPTAGTLLKRAYKGQMIHVRVLPQGFEFNGEVYRSLSAIAHKITGSHWNGYRFFQLPKPRKEAVIQ